MARETVTIRQAWRLGYDDGHEMAAESGTAEAPRDGWDGCAINSAGLAEMCRVLGEPYATNRGGYTKRMYAKLVAYSKGAQAGADAAVAE